MEFMYPEEVLRHRGTKEGVATSEAWLPCLGMDLLQVYFTSHMDWNFRTNSAIVFSQVFVRSRVTLTWCRGATMVFAIKSLRLFNQSEAGMAPCSILKVPISVFFFCVSGSH